MISQPDATGHFGKFGGKYVPETLYAALEQLEECYLAAKEDPDFKKEYLYYLRHYLGRPTPLYYAAEFSKRIGRGNRVLVKREDLNHTGAHKMNNTLGQGMLTRRLGKRRILAETGAGMHGVATATAAALLRLECEVFMGEVDIKRQSQNVSRMKMLGAKVTAATTGSRTLKDATNEAMRTWIAEVETTHFVIGSIVGPHPFPVIVRDFQRVIGDEARAQCLEQEGRLPDMIVACVGGGSNAIGAFYPFLDDDGVELVGVEAAGRGLDSGLHAASLSLGTLGIIHGAKTFLLQDEDGQITEAHSVSAGLDYPGTGAEHSHLQDIGRAKYTSVTDDQAIDALLTFTRDEGIIPALESSHALAHVLYGDVGENRTIIVNLSGRGDKDMGIVDEYLKARNGGQL